MLNLVVQEVTTGFLIVEGGCYFILWKSMAYAAWL